MVNTRQHKIQYEGMYVEESGKDDGQKGWQCVREFPGGGTRGSGLQNWAHKKVLDLAHHHATRVTKAAPPTLAQKNNACAVRCCSLCAIKSPSYPAQ